MAIKKPLEPLSLFSMSSMTDVIFLLLIFFMVTSSFVFPSAVDVNLPQSSNQFSNRPVTEVSLDSLLHISIVEDRTDTVNPEKTQPHQLENIDLLAARLAQIRAVDSVRPVALYADKSVEYGNVVEILDAAAKQNIKMVLATRAPQPKE